MRVNAKMMDNISLEDAIKISQILAKAPEERIPMILSVLEKADVSIDGLEELEEWRIYKDMSTVIDLAEFMEKLEKKFSGRLEKGFYKIPTVEFSEFCISLKLKPRLVRQLLARKGAIETAEAGKKTEYTLPVRLDGKRMRCVVARKDWRQALR